jgi:flagellar biosynthesis/type III secretory pathway protein FliH
MISKRVAGTAVLMAALLWLGACTSSRETRGERDADANSPAGKFGQAAHHAADKLNKAAAEANRKIDKAAHDARAGWNQASRTGDKKDSR